ncbi:MAG: helix-turn-helix domain-containing protein [Xanthomonadales bacterium]|nr:HTH-type transcriptional activator RhaS [Xanthomonadales bacterium]MCC6591649.1 helix-turn-helix domain-containing protein [Xanthomonadales bacterium]
MTHTPRAALLLLLSASAAARADELPYCGFGAQIDASSAEWRAPWLEAAIDEPDGQPAQRNRTRIRACWNLDALLLAVEVEDADPVHAPPGLDVDRFHQYDSLQLYLDPHADAGARMNDDDVDLLLLPDGRFGVLRGDALIGALAGASVPQRVAAPLALDYATRARPQGWELELRLPWAGIGVQPAAGVRIGVDVAASDWLVDHPPGGSQAFTPERVRALAGHAPEAPEPDATVGLQLLPRNWSGDSDFGYPQRWRQLQLVGAPGSLERLQRALGPQALAWIGIAGLGLGLLCTVMVHNWHRRRLRELLARLAALTPAAPMARSGAESPEAAAAAAGTSTDDADAATADADPRDREFAERVLAYARAHLDQALTPAALAEHFHVSLRTLQRRLKAGLDSSPQDLVLAARLEAARTLLREGRLRVGEVAARVGFEDLSHFSRRYRQAYGHPPSAETG